MMPGRSSPESAPRRSSGQPITRAAARTRQQAGADRRPRHRHVHADLRRAAVGIFAGSGVGKSTLLAMLTRARGFDTVVLALVGERGREVREFLEDTLGAGANESRSVVSTGDESAAMRRLAPKTAMTVAEYFRDRGESVLLIMDSVTRFAHAAREVALAAGEPAVARGYAPSVFSDLPKLLERAGPGAVEGGFDHRHLLGARRRRRPQRSGRRFHPRHA